MGSGLCFMSVLTLLYVFSVWYSVWCLKHSLIKFFLLCDSILHTSKASSPCLNTFHHVESERGLICHSWLLRGKLTAPLPLTHLLLIRPHVTGSGCKHYRIWLPLQSRNEISKDLGSGNQQQQKQRSHKPGEALRQCNADVPRYIMKYFTATN